MCDILPVTKTVSICWSAAQETNKIGQFAPPWKASKKKFFTVNPFQVKTWANCQKFLDYGTPLAKVYGGVRSVEAFRMERKLADASR